MSYMRFAKMHGAGNDFIVVDQSRPVGNFTPERIRVLCDRRRGIGADGLILLARTGMPGETGVKMDFYNCDGSRASLCGNGLRCAAAFAAKRGLAPGPDIVFNTPCGDLRTRILGANRVRIELPLDEKGFHRCENFSDREVYTGFVGVPHTVVFVPDPDTTDVDAMGREFRWHKAFQPEGTNVDFLPEKPNLSRPVKLRTFERGVEAETLACGTGAGASACVLRMKNPNLEKVLFLSRSGDVLEVEFPKEWNILKGMYLTGPAIESFHGATEAFDLD